MTTRKKTAATKSTPAKTSARAKKAPAKAPAKPASKAVKKPAAKKAPAKRPAKSQPAAKKAGASSQKAAVRKPVPKKAAAKKRATKPAVPAKKATPKRTGGAKKAAPAKTEKPAAEAVEVPEEAKKIVLGARKRMSTPSVFKARKNKNTPIVFTMEDVAEILEKKGSAGEPSAPAPKDKKNPAPADTSAAEKPATAVGGETEAPVERKNHGTVSVADILGFNPAAAKGGTRPIQDVPRKWSKFHKALLELRDHVSTGLALHSADTLKRSNKEDSGDLSGYGQHSADAGTDTFDRDLALNLVSNEQELLYEIEEAIQRIYKNTYGVCEITGEPIDKERLMAVPFTRCSLEGQRELERTRKNKANRGALFSTDSDETFSLGDEDADN